MSRVAQPSTDTKPTIDLAMPARTWLTRLLYRGQAAVCTFIGRKLSSSDLLKGMAGDLEARKEYLKTRNFVFHSLPSEVQNRVIQLVKTAYRQALPTDGRHKKRAVMETSEAQELRAKQKYTDRAIVAVTDVEPRPMTGQWLGNFRLITALSLNGLLALPESTERRGYGIARMHRRGRAPAEGKHSRYITPTCSLCDPFVGKELRAVLPQIIPTLFKATVISDFFAAHRIEISGASILKLADRVDEVWTLTAQRPVRNVLALMRHLTEHTHTKRADTAAVSRLVEKFMWSTDAVGSYTDWRAHVEKTAMKHAAVKQSAAPAVSLSGAVASNGAVLTLRPESVIAKAIVDSGASTDGALRLARHLWKLAVSLDSTITSASVCSMMQSAGDPETLRDLLRQKLRESCRPVRSSAAASGWDEEPLDPRATACEVVDREGRRLVRAALRQRGSIDFHELKRILKTWGVTHSLSDGPGSHGVLRRECPGGSEKLHQTSKDLHNGTLEVSPNVLFYLLKELDIPLAEFAGVLGT